MTPSALLASSSLAVDAEDVSAGPLGLLVVVLMIVATVFLIRNMNARLRRLPREFPEPGSDEQRPGSDDGPARSS